MEDECAVEGEEEERGSHRLKEIEKWGRRRVLRGMDSSVAGV